MTNKNDILSKSKINRMLHHIDEYHRIKQKQSPLFKTVKAFCSYHGFSRQNFLKFYGRWRNNPNDFSTLLPRKRGPRFKTRRIDLNTENLIVSLRELGNNKYEIKNAIKANQPLNTPCATTIYNYCKKHGLNVLNKAQKQEHRKIIISRIGELLHADCHHLSKGITITAYKKLYLVGIIDGYSRCAWVEVTTDIKALTVMFAILRCLNILRSRYNIEAEVILTDNGAEFGKGALVKNYCCPVKVFIM